MGLGAGDAWVGSAFPSPCWEDSPRGNWVWGSDSDAEGGGGRRGSLKRGAAPVN